MKQVSSSKFLVLSEENLRALVCLVLLSTAALLMAFVSEPALGLRGEAGGVFSG
jgi:hypothetical protein